LILGRGFDERAPSLDDAAVDLREVVDPSGRAARDVREECTEEALAIAALPLRIVEKGGRAAGTRPILEEVAA
jgi:hypothetical protein